MERIKLFDEFIKEDKEFNEYTLKIDNEYTELEKGKDETEIELGKVDRFSDTNIQNIKRTYPKGEVKIKNGRFILKFNESIDEE